MCSFRPEQRVGLIDISVMLFIESQFYDWCFHPYRVFDESVELCEALFEVSQYIIVLQVLIYEHLRAETIRLFAFRLSHSALCCHEKEQNSS